MYVRFIFLMIFLAPVSLFAQDPTTFPASPIPDRILLSVAADPATAMGVSWRSDMTVSGGYAEIKPATAAPEEEGAVRLTARVTSLELEDSRSNYFEVDFTHLQPATLYMYRVGDSLHRSEWLHFKTATAGFQPFSFIYLGDAQNSHKTWWSRAIRAAALHQPDAAFTLYAGDLINRTNVDKEWGEWFYAGGWLHSMIPTLPAAGNHEFYRDTARQLTLTKHWRSIFNLPLNGPEGLEELTYYIDYQQVRIISLSSQSLLLSEADSASQVQWLEQVLQNNPQRWTIVTMHHPVYSSGKGRDNQSLRDALLPLFNKYKVDLVLTGHDHTYGRGISEHSTHRKKATLDGPVYMVSVSGPKMYVPSLQPWLQRAGSNAQLFQTVTIEENRILVKAFTVTGELYDAFEIIRKRNGQKQMIDQAPSGKAEQLELPASYRQRYNATEKQQFDNIRKAYFDRKED